MKKLTDVFRPSSWMLTTLTVVVIFSLWPVGLPPALAASERFIAPDGTDAGTCAEVTAACKTFAYTLAQAANGDTIRVAAGTYTEAGIVIDKDMTIIGEGVVVVQAAATMAEATNRVFTVRPDTTVTLRNLEIRHGNTSTLEEQGSGGGIRNQGHLTLDNVRLKNNLSGLYGGGLASIGMEDKLATLRVKNSDIFENSATNPVSRGGGMFSDYTDTLITDSSISRNEATIGGGIYHLGGGLEIRNSEIEQNKSTLGGGGIWVRSSVVLPETKALATTAIIRDSRIHGNEVSGTGTTGAGIEVIAVDTDATLTVINSTISGNKLTSNEAVGGAGISMDAFSNYTAHLRVIDSTISGNETAGQNIETGFGGGIRSGFITGAQGAKTIVEIDNSTITDNVAINGGGIASGSNLPGNTSTLTITESLIANNVAKAEVDAPQVGNGGGIFHLSGPLTLVNSTISQNQAGGGAQPSAINANGLGGGIGLPSAPGTTKTTAAITNTSIISNTAVVAGGGVATIGIDVPDVPIPPTGSATSFKNTLLVGNTAMGVAQASSCITQGTNATSTSNGNNLGPLDAAINMPGMLVTCGLGENEVLPNTNNVVGPLADNGGPTFTHALLPVSPAINKGASVEGLTTDQRGAVRDATPDIGAYEVTDPEYDLGLTVDVPATEIAAGQPFSYTLKVVNVGPAPTTAISLTSILPDGVTFVGWEGSGWACSDVDEEGQISCEHPGLGSQTLTEILEVKIITPATAGSITLGGEITAPLAGDTIRANNSDSIAVSVTVLPDPGDRFRTYMPIIVR